MPCPTNYFYHFTLRFIESSKPNPNQISTSNGKAGTVNGAVGTTFQPQNTLLGRACESCYGECSEVVPGWWGAVLHWGGGQRKGGREKLLEVMLLLCRGRWYLFKVSGVPVLVSHWEQRGIRWVPSHRTDKEGVHLLWFPLWALCLLAGFVVFF